MSYDYWNNEINKISNVTYTVSNALDIDGFDKVKITDTISKLTHLTHLAQIIFDDLGPSLDDDQYTSGEELNHSEEYHNLKKVVQEQIADISQIAAKLENEECAKHGYCDNERITYLRYVDNEFY